MKIKKYLQHSPVFAINSAYEAIVPQVNRRLRKLDLNLLQGLVLTALFFEDNAEVNPSHLADIFQTSRGNMSHILSSLEYQGYVRRVVHEKDARKFKIELKNDGRKKAISLIKFYDKLQDSFEKSMNAAACQRSVDGVNLIKKAFLENKWD